MAKLGNWDSQGHTEEAPVPHCAAQRRWAANVHGGLTVEGPGTFLDRALQLNCFLESSHPVPPPPRNWNGGVGNSGHLVKNCLDLMAFDKTQILSSAFDFRPFLVDPTPPPPQEGWFGAKKKTSQSFPSWGRTHVKQ